jgi:hypothetical protein
MTPHTSSPYRRARAYLAGFAVLASAFVALALPATAMATPCGDKVLADWFDNGRIDRLYPLHCYEEAIDAIPDAEEIISRALQAAVSGNLAPGGPDPTPGGPGDPGDPTGSGDPGDPNNPNDPNGGSEAAPDVDTSGPSSIPIPLLVLGGMSIALLAAGGLGYLSRRRNAGGPDDPDDPSDDDIIV